MEKVNIFKEGGAEKSKRIVVHVPGTEGRALGYAGRCAPWAPGGGQGTRRRLPLLAGVACGARRYCRCRCSRSRFRCYRGALCAASRAPHGCASWSVLPYSTSHDLCNHTQQARSLDVAGGARHRSCMPRRHEACLFITPNQRTTVWGSPSGT